MVCVLLILAAKRLIYLSSKHNFRCHRYMRVVFCHQFINIDNMDRNGGHIFKDRNFYFIITNYPVTKDFMF